MTESSKKLVTAKESRKAAKLFSYGNIVAVLIPFPIFIFWFGASMFVYAFHRHHPNPRVGYYTQKAATNYYTLAGFLSVVMLFASGNFFFKYGWMLWLVCVVILVPLSIMDIRKVNNEEWQDTKVNDTNENT